MLPRIYCDMDGVLCDFKKAAEKVTGMPISKWSYASKTEKWQPIKDTPKFWHTMPCLLYTSPSPRDGLLSRMPSSA